MGPLATLFSNIDRAKRYVGGLLDGPAMAIDPVSKKRLIDDLASGTGAGTSNFVIFPGNENLLRILERNGIPLD